MPRKKTLVDKELIKLSAGRCRFCPESRYGCLHVHRIIPGEMGGTYVPDNVVVLCSNCHNAVHDGYYTIDRWYTSTGGRVLRVMVGKGEKKEERFY